MVVHMSGAESKGVLKTWICAPRMDSKFIKCIVQTEAEKPDYIIKLEEDIMRKSLLLKSQVSNFCIIIVVNLLSL